ncbi:A kinase (PRKA) anchor protein 11 [Cricetulus griseus]
MAAFQPFRNSHIKNKASVRKSFSEDVFQSVKSLLQSEKELCSVSGGECLNQDEHAHLTEVTFLGFNEDTDAAHIQDLAAVSLELPDLLNSLHFCSLSENEIICMKDMSKSSDVSSSPLNQTTSGLHLETHDFKVLVSYGPQKSLAKPSSSVHALGRKEASSVKTSVTTSVSEPWTQRSLYRSPSASDKGRDTQEILFPSSPAHSSESECSSPSPVIFLDEEGYQKSLKAKLELPEIPVTKDDIEDSDSEVSEFFDSFDQFDELEQTLETSCPFMKDPDIEKSLQKIGHKHEKSCMNPQKFKFERPALPANVRKPTPRKPESPYGHLCDAPDSPRPVMASEDSGLFSPIRASAFSPPGSCTPAECFCQTDIGRDRSYENQDPIYCTYEDYANNLSHEVLGSVLHTQCVNAMSDTNSIKRGEDYPVAFKHGNSDQKSKYKNKSSVITDSVQKFAADLVGRSFGNAFKDLQKGVSSCTNALCHFAVKLTSSVFQMAFNELRRQCAFSLKERAIGSLASLLVSEALSNALKDLQYVKKQMFTNTVARFAADLAEELVFEGIMEVCQFSCPPTPASKCPSFDFEDKVVKSYAKDLSESVIQEAFIELSQTDVTFTTKAAVNVSMGNVNYASAESGVLPTQTFTFSSSFSSQAIMTKPVQEHKKEYTVQQALFCTSGIVTSIPVPLAGSALLPYHISSTLYQSRSHPSSEHSKANDGSTQEHITTESSEEEVDCLRDIVLPSELNPCNQNDFKPTNGDTDIQSPSKITSGSMIISNFSAAMVHSIVSETLESMTTFKTTKTVDAHSDYLTKTKEKVCPPSICDQVAPQQSKASSKDMFAEQLSKSIIKHSLDKSKSMLPNIDNKTVSTELVPILGEESQLILEESPKFLGFTDHLPHCSLLAGKHCVPECKDSVGFGFSLESLPPCSMMSSQKSDLKELVKDKPVKRHNLNNTTLEPLSFGLESSFRHSHALSSAVLTCVDGLHVEDKQKIRDRNVIPDTPPSTPLVPSQTSSEWDIKKLTKKLKGELAKEFAPATPPSTPHNSSAGSLSENEQNPIEKEEFMLKLMRSLSEEVDSSEGEEHPEMDVNSDVKISKELLTSNKEHCQEVDKRQRRRNGSHLCNYQPCERTRDPCGNELSELHSFSASLASIITRDVKKQLTAPTVDLPQPSTDSCLREKSGCIDKGEGIIEPEFSKSHQPLQNHGFCQNTGTLSGHSRGENAQALEQYASKVVDDTLELSLGPTVFHIPETTASADRITYAEKLSPLMNGTCRYCDLKERHGCARSPSQPPLKQSVCASAKPGSHPKLGSIHQKSRIFHLDVPQIHVNLDKRAVLAEKIVAEAIEKAERELSNTSLAADSGIGQDGISFAESLTTEIMTSAVTNAEHVVSSPKEIEDFQSTESLGSQQLNLSVGEDSTGSWSNLSFEDDHQDESSSFHHLSESSNGNSSSWSSLGLEGDLYEDNLSFPTSDSDEPDDRDDDQEDGAEDLRQNGKTLLIVNIDLEPGAVDPQLRVLLQWLVASEAEVEELYFQDSSKKEFILVSTSPLVQL